MAEILAAYLQSNLRRLRSDPDLGERVLEHLPKEKLADVELAWRLSWLPWEYIVEAGEAVMKAAVSEDAAAEYVRRSVSSALGEPFLRRIVDGGLAIVGREPERMAPWIPTIWRAISRNAGELCWECEAPGSGRLRWDAPPACALASPLYQRSVALSFLPIFDLAGTTGTVDVRSEADGSLVFELRWPE